MTAVVLDASALLAYLHREPGWQRVSGAPGDGATISSVNWCEVARKARMAELDVNLARTLLHGMGLAIEAFSAAHADVAKSTRRAGLSLANRACLALALGAQIELIR